MTNMQLFIVLIVHTNVIFYFLFFYFNHFFIDGPPLCLIWFFSIELLTQCVAFLGSGFHRAPLSMCGSVTSYHTFVTCAMHQDA